MMERFSTRRAATRTSQVISRATAAIQWIDPLEPRRMLSHPGDLDPSFSGDGKATVDVGGTVTVNAQDVALQTDGKAVVVGNDSSGDFVVARFNLDGTLDGTFGPN